MARLLSRPVICPVLIGRAREVDALHRLIDEVSAGRGCAALVAGEAGAGKSRLVAEAKAYASGCGFLVLQGACFPQDAASPYAPLLDMVRARLASRATDAVAAELGALVYTLAPLLPEIMPDQPGLPPGEAEPEQARRLHAALANCLSAGASSQPVLLILEDLHWSDQASLDALLHLLRRAAVCPVLLLGTYRADEAGGQLRQWLTQVDRERLATELTLAPLARDQVAAMIGAILGHERPADGLVAALNALAEGNPFYVEELLKSLVESGEITVDAGGWRHRPLTDLQIPRSLHAAVQQRIEQLSPAARDLLTLAAVVGRRFDFDLLRRLTEIDEATLLTRIKELIAAQLVVEESSDAFAFRHALTRQVAYGDLLARERAALHRAVAEEAEEMYAAKLDQHLPDLAYHFAAAEEWDKTLVYARRAGEQAQRLYAPSVAIDQFTRALDAAEHLARSSGEDAGEILASVLPGLYRERGHAHDLHGDVPRAMGDFQTALDLARAAGGRRAEWQSLIDLGLLWSGQDYARAGQYFTDALARARALGEPALIAHSLNRAGNWHANAADPRDALPLHQEALALYEQAQDPRGIAESLDLLGMAHYLAGDPHASVGYTERAAAAFRRLDDRRSLVTSLGLLAELRGSYGPAAMSADPAGRAAAVAAGEEAIRIAQDMGWRAGEVFASFVLATGLVPLGEHKRALNLLERGLQIAEEIGHRQWISATHCNFGDVYLDLLALPAARRHLESALALAREIGSTFWIRLAAGRLAQTLVLMRDLAGAEAVLDSVPETVLDVPVASTGAWLGLVARLHLDIARGDVPHALDLLPHLTGTSAGGRSLDTPNLVLARGTVFATLGRVEEAEAAFRQVQQVAHGQGARAIEWRSRLGLGALSRERGDHDEARREFSAARAIVEAIAADLPDSALRAEFLQNATALLPRAYRLSPRRAVAARFGGLTEREREVAALIAEGRTNREIAGALVLGERTIETHVSNILGKLGSSTRQQIAAWAIEQGLTGADIS